MKDLKEFKICVFIIDIGLHELSYLCAKSVTKHLVNDDYQLYISTTDLYPNELHLNNVIYLDPRPLRTHGETAVSLVREYQSEFDYLLFLHHDMIFTQSFQIQKNKIILSPETIWNFSLYHGENFKLFHTIIFGFPSNTFCDEHLELFLEVNDLESFLARAEKYKFNIKPILRPNGLYADSFELAQYFIIKSQGAAFEKMSSGFYHLSSMGMLILKQKKLINDHQFKSKLKYASENISLIKNMVWRGESSFIDSSNQIIKLEPQNFVNCSIKSYLRESNKILEL